MTFTHSPFLLFLLFLPLIAVFFIWRARVKAAALRRIGDADLVRTLAAQISPTRRRWKNVLWLLAVGMLIVALARPVWGIVAEVTETQGVAVIVVLDVSKSMDAEDMGGRLSRLERAKLDLRTLFEALAGNDIGLILFAGQAYVQLPLTNDVRAATTFLEAATTDSVTRQGTALAEALQLAMDSFGERIAARSVVVVVSDGENHVADPTHAAQEAAAQDIIIHTLGYGGEDGATIPVRLDSGLTEPKADRNGRIVLTRLEEETLRNVAEAAGGTYRRGGGSGAEIVELASEINALDSATLDRERTTRPVDRFGIFVALALLALSLEMLLPETRGRAS